MRNVPWYQNPTVKRLFGCLALGLVLSLMIGKQQGSRDDYYVGIKKALFGPSILGPRIILFLLVGVGVFFLITYWSRIKPYLGRPGIKPMAIGALGVVMGYVLLKWTDNSRAAADGKLGTLSDAASSTEGLSPIAQTFFTMPVPWILFLVSLIATLIAVILRNRVLGYAAAAICVVAGLWGYLAHGYVQSFLGTPDHSLGSAFQLLAYLTIAGGALVAARSHLEVADTKNFIRRAFAWRPGLFLAAIGSLVGLESLLQATWFSPQGRNATLVDMSALFAGSGLAPVGQQFLRWGAFVLLGAAILVGLVATLGLARKKLGWVAFGVGVVGALLTLLTLYLATGYAASEGFEGATGHWQNLGAGGWLAAMAFVMLAGAGWIVATLDAPVQVEKAERDLMSSDTVGGSVRHIPGMKYALLIAVIAVALFYPPTMTEYWQNVLVSQIGIFVLLAIGLNVVVGWAGLLDLGFIAFYAVGSYTTAWLVGSLPAKPPFTVSPLWAIPVAVIFALIAGVMLGAPTLRLRGDYLAIVTLGFGEIVRIVAVNAESITNSTRGPSPAVPHPAISIGPLQWEWGLNYLQYWYLLLVIMVLVIIGFRRLEDSRLGRAWAAIREDEVAAQATGVNTFRAKLFAFAIGASTSGIAGVFFASQVGYFNPQNFTLEYSILVVAYVVFGGMGSLPGAMAGAAVLTWLPEFLKEQVPAEDRQMWIGAVILLMMIFRPAGLIPATRRETELEGIDEAPRIEPRAVPESESMGATS